MNRYRNDLINSYRHRGRRYSGRPKAGCASHAASRHRPCKRVPGALFGTMPVNQLPFGNHRIVAADVIDAGHGTGLSVMWMVRCDHRRVVPTRSRLAGGARRRTNAAANA